MRSRSSYSGSVPEDTSFADGRKVEHGVAITCTAGNRLRSPQEWQEEPLAVGRRRDCDSDMFLWRLDGIYTASKSGKIGEVAQHAAVRSAGDRCGDLWTGLNLHRVPSFQTREERWLSIAESRFEVCFQRGIVNFPWAVWKVEHVRRGEEFSGVGSGNYYPLSVLHQCSQCVFLSRAERPDVRQNQCLPVEVRQCTGGNDLKLQMLLHQENEDAAIGSNEVSSIKVPRIRGKINANWVNGNAWRVKLLFIRLYP